MKYFLLILSIILSSCAIYKTREFNQQREVEIEDWFVEVYLHAFSGSSSASWKNHQFDTYAEISTYRNGKYHNATREISIVDYKLYSDKCPGAEEFEFQGVKLKTHEHGRKTVTPNIGGISIDKAVKNVCAHVTLQYLDNKNTKNVQISLRRHESFFPFIAMY